MPRFNECNRCQKRCTKVPCDRCGVAKYCSRTCQDKDQWRHKAVCDAAAFRKRCQGCGKVSESLKTCSGCFQSFYCSGECQTKDWQKHKGRCKEVKRKIKCIAKQIATRFAGMSVTPKLYYWGNYPAFDYLNLEENEGCAYTNPLNVLVLGVGDIRNVCLTCASLPKNLNVEAVNFTLNDDQPCTLARLVLLLYMLIQGEPTHVYQVTEVWYSTKLSEETYQSLCSFLRDLSEMTSSDQLDQKTNGLLVIDESHLNDLRRVWKTWLELSVLKTDWIRKQRQQVFENDRESEYGINSYCLCLPSEHVKSARKWMRDGVFAGSKAELVYENPTYTGCPKIFEKSRSYSSLFFDASILPFSAWDYVEVKKFGHRNSIVEMYRVYINDVLQRSKQNLVGGRIRFKAVLANCMVINQYLSTDEKYDRILTSNLTDYIPLPQLLQLCSEKLNHSNPHATIVTETQNWLDSFYPEAGVEALNPTIIMEMTSWVVQDTESGALLKDYGYMTYRDYHDNSNQFLEYLRASFYAFAPTSAPLPSANELGNEFQLKLRNFLRGENTITPFKIALNCRRASLIRGYERVLEWIPMK